MMKSRGRYQESRLRSGAQWRGHINKAYNEPLRTSIETRRLILRPFEPGDVETAFAWLGDPIVMRFTPSSRRKPGWPTIKSTRPNMLQEWIVLDRHLCRPIGDSGLLALQEYDWIDLGFRL